jgi:hypothetical protein
MRQDIADLLRNRPSWRLLTDQTYQDLLAARDIAIKEKDHASVEILDKMIAEQKDTILSGLNPKIFSVSRSST